MKNCLKNELKERLSNRLEWADYFESYLKHQEINKKVSQEFYKNKTFLSFILKFYFLPLNLIDFYNKIKTWHYYLKIQKEIEVLKQEIEE